MTKLAFRQEYGAGEYYLRVYWKKLHIFEDEY